nr:hypothetical protein [Sinorhizobium saheli]
MPSARRGRTSGAIGVLQGRPALHSADHLCALRQLPPLLFHAGPPAADELRTDRRFHPRTAISRLSRICPTKCER